MINLKSTVAFSFPPRTFQHVAVILGALGIASSGMQNGWSSPSLPQLLSPNSSIPTTSSEGSWIAVMPLFGSTVGCIIASLLIDIIGRKGIILLAGFPLSIGWLMVGFSKTVSSLIISRLISGIGGGLMYSSLPMYTAEIADPTTRGFLGSLSCTLWFFGVLLVNLIGNYCSISTTAFISASIPLIMILTFLWMPESFYYYIMKGNMEGARKSLKAFRPQEEVEDELKRIADAIKEENKNKGQIWELITIKSNRKATMLSLGLYSFQQLSGTTAIIYYLKTIFEATGVEMSPNLLSLIYISLLIIVSSISCSVVDKVGRRPLSIISSIGSTLMLFIVGTYFLVMNNIEKDISSFSWIPCAMLMVFISIFCIGMQGIPVIMSAELFPTNMKKFAFPMVMIYFNSSATVAGKMFQILDDIYGIYMPFYFFGCSAAASILFYSICLPETKGKNLEEIQELLKKNTISIGKARNKSVKSDVTATTQM